MKTKGSFKNTKPCCKEYKKIQPEISLELMTDKIRSIIRTSSKDLRRASRWRAFTLRILTWKKIIKKSIRLLLNNFTQIVFLSHCL